MKRYLETTSIKKKTLINGHDLMNIFGIGPSPLLGRILQSIEELQMAGALFDRENAVKWVADYLNKNGGASDS